MVRTVASFIGRLAVRASRTSSELAGPCDQRKSITTCSSSLSGLRVDFLELRIVTLQLVTDINQRVKGIVREAGSIVLNVGQAFPPVHCACIETIDRQECLSYWALRYPCRGCGFLI